MLLLSFPGDRRHGSPAPGRGRRAPCRRVYRWRGARWPAGPDPLPALVTAPPGLRPALQVQRAGIRRGVPSRPGAPGSPWPRAGNAWCSPRRLRSASRSRAITHSHTLSIRPAAAGGTSPPAGDISPASAPSVPRPGSDTRFSA